MFLLVSDKVALVFLVLLCRSAEWAGGGGYDGGVGGECAAEAGTVVTAAVRVAPGVGPPGPTLRQGPEGGFHYLGPGFATAWALLPEGLGLSCPQPEAGSSLVKS